MLAQLEWQKAERKRPEDFRAWDYCHKALWHLYRFTVEDLQAARGWFRMALELEPGLARAHAGLACVSVQLAFYGTPAARAEELRQALALFRLDRLEEAEDYVRAAVRQPHAAY
jgi:hypothetical protein